MSALSTNKLHGIERTDSRRLQNASAVAMAVHKKSPPSFATPGFASA
jgi:hypothetical protein